MDENQTPVQGDQQPTVAPDQNPGVGGVPTDPGVGGGDAGAGAPTEGGAPVGGDENNGGGAPGQV
jgi:hypothetical protein